MVEDKILTSTRAKETLSKLQKGQLEPDSHT